MGLFHSSELNSYNLADDFIEVFRPVVDLHVYLISLLKPDTRKYGYIKIEIRFLPDLYPCHMQQIRILNINLKTIRNCIIFIYRMLQIIQKCIKP